MLFQENAPRKFVKISAQKGEKMKEKTWKVFERLIPLLVTVAIAIGGWYVVDILAVKRDRANKQRNLRSEYLITTFNKLANASWREPKPGSQYFTDMETAIADIQLFGTHSQITKAGAMIDEFQRTRSASLDELLRDLRDDLRREMDLPEIEENVRWFRPEGVPISPATSEKR